MSKIIISVEKDSIAEELGISPGDELFDISGNEIRDVFDYRYHCQSETLELCIIRGTETMLYEIEKDEYEDLGLVFDSGLMDEPKRCANKCLFCFIDQLPYELRDSLYFKDDDYRLSFLTGNYVTLTNMSETDFKRLLFYRLSPINISLHTLNPDLRVKMLGNPNAAKINNFLDTLFENRIDMNFQIVLCPGINDGEQLSYSIAGLKKYFPYAKSLSVVPVGLTKHRQGLYNMPEYTLETSAQVIFTVEHWQNEFKKSHGTNFIYAADEFYIKAELPIPNYESYEDFPQIENGVGMLASFRHEFENELRSAKKRRNKNNKTKKDKTYIITGTAAYAAISELCEVFNHVEVIPVANDYFGETVTVSGLITSADIQKTLISEKIPGGNVLIPSNMLRNDGKTDTDRVFLDNVSVLELKKNLKVYGIDCVFKVIAVDGAELARVLLS